MANICDYKVIVKGKKNACYAFYGSMPAYNDKYVVEEEGTDENYTLRFNGDCKWSVDQYSKAWKGTSPVALPDDPDEAMEEAQEKYCDIYVQDRSKMFNIEVLCNSADIEDFNPIEGPDEIFEHYKNGCEVYDDCPSELRIAEEYDEIPFEKIRAAFPLILSIEGTAYEGRIERIENVKVGDPLIIKADYYNRFYDPVAIEVFNMKNETLGYLARRCLDVLEGDEFAYDALWLIAKHVDKLKARVVSVTPLSQRAKNAKYALMDVELSVKEDYEDEDEDYDNDEDYAEDEEVSFSKEEVFELFENMVNFTEILDSTEEFADKLADDEYNWELYLRSDLLTFLLYINKGKEGFDDLKIETLNFVYGEEHTIEHYKELSEQITEGPDPDSMIMRGCVAYDMISCMTNLTDDDDDEIMFSSVLVRLYKEMAKLFTLYDSDAKTESIIKKHTEAMEKSVEEALGIGFGAVTDFANSSKTQTNKRETASKSTKTAPKSKQQKNSVEISASDFVIDEFNVLKEYNGDATELILPTGIKVIDEYALSGNENITSVVIPEGVTVVKNSAFSNCKNLKKVILPNSLREIEEGAFCFTAIENIEIPEGVETIGKEAFYACEKLSTIAIPGTVYKIGEDAFGSCDSLETVHILDGCDELGDKCFAQCENLKDIYIPDSVRTIGEDVFFLNHIIEIHTPSGSYAETYADENIIYCDNEGFADTTKVRTAEEIAQQEEKERQEAAEKPKLDYVVENGILKKYTGTAKKVIIPKEIKEIADNAFADCKNLQAVEFCEGLVKIGKGAFKNTGLTYVDLPSTVNVIEKDAFDDTCVVAVNGEMPYYFSRTSEIEKLRQGIDEKDKLVTETMNRKQTLQKSLDEYINAKPSEFSEIEEYQKQISEIEKERADYSRKSTEKSTALNNFIAQKREENAKLTEERRKCFFLAVSKKKELDAQIQGKQNELKLLYAEQEKTNEEFRATDNNFKEKIDKKREELDALSYMRNRWESDRNAKINTISSVETELQGYIEEITSLKANLEKAEAYERTHIEWLEKKEKAISELAAQKFDESETVAFEITAEMVKNQKEQKLKDVEEKTSAAETVVTDAIKSIKKNSGNNLNILNGELRWAEKVKGKVVVPEGVESIGNNAFDMCEKLEEIVLPSTLRKIGTEAFSMCKKLKRIVIPEGCEVIEKKCFAWCEKLEEIVLPSTLLKIGTEAFLYCGELKKIVIPEGCEEIGGKCFSDCKNLSDIYIPLSVSKIANTAFNAIKKTIVIHTPKGSFAETYAEKNKARFDNNYVAQKEDKLKAEGGGVKIPESDYKIENGVLIAYLGNEKKIILPDGIREIGENAFDKNKEITSVVIPEGVIAIRKNAFDGCFDLKEIVLPNSLRKIESRAFSFCDLNSIIVPAGIEKLEEETFYGCEKLKEISLPNTLHEIGKKTFSGCKKLTSIIIPDGCETLGEECFAGCKKLKDIYVPSSVRNFGKNALDTYAEGVVIHTPSGSAAEKYIHENYWFSDSFLRVDNKTQIEVEQEKANDDRRNVNQAQVKKGKDPTGSIEDDSTSTQKNIFKNKTFTPEYDEDTMDDDADENIQDYYDDLRAQGKISAYGDYEIDDSGYVVSYNGNSNNLVLPNGIRGINKGAFAGSYINSVVIPEGVKAIRAGAFYQCSELKKITLPSTLRKIGFSAFYECEELAKVDIPEGVEKIGANAFNSCYNLEKITLPSTLSEIGGAAFASCKSLEKITIPKGVGTIERLTFASCASLSKITLPTTITKLEESAFSMCGLNSITIPKGCKEIGDRCFMWCANLEEIHLPASIEKFGDDAFAGVNARVHAPSGSYAAFYFAMENLMGDVFKSMRDDED